MWQPRECESKVNSRAGTTAQIKSIGVVFPFNEVNAGVFQNAGLWSAKTNYGVETVVYTPNQFKGLYFSADKIIEIHPIPYLTYQEVSEYEPNTIAKKKLKTWMSRGTLNYFHHKFLEALPASLFHTLPSLVRSDFKTRKFLVQSGILKLSKMNFYSNNSDLNSKFFGDSLYINLANFERKKKNLQEYFQYSFENLYNMISSEILNKEIYCSDEEKTSIALPLEFLARFNSRYPKILLRTRNINSSVKFQNAPVLELNRLIMELLQNGFVIINSGVPAASLHITHENYFEYSHNLPIDVEMYLADKCDYVMQTAWAGLFTAFASFHKPLITFSEEWSTKNLRKPISLLEARKLIGFNDIKLGEDFASKDGSASISVKKIIAKL